MPHQPIYITHLSQIVDKYRLDLYCKNCGRHVKVDIPEIIETRGDMEIQVGAAVIGPAKTKIGSTPGR